MAKKMSLAQKVNVLRAAVMGTNDGIISVAGIVFGVAGANTSSFAILISGLAGMLAGTVSMAMGEYVSVHSQTDAQETAISQEKALLQNDFSGQVAFLTDKLQTAGISSALANKAAGEMLEKAPLVTLVREKHGFDPNEKTSPYAAALASMISFPMGSALPLLSVVLFPTVMRLQGTMLSVLIALVLTGYVAAILSNSNRLHGTIRNVISGLFTMVVTYLIGTLFA